MRNRYILVCVCIGYTVYTRVRKKKKKERGLYGSPYCPRNPNCFLSWKNRSFTHIRRHQKAVLRKMKKIRRNLHFSTYTDNMGLQSRKHYISKNEMRFINKILYLIPTLKYIAYLPNTIYNLYFILILKYTSK